MKHDLITPCNQCPFRTTSAAGWLGSYTPESIIAGIREEIPFPCHMTVDYEKPDWREKLNAPRTRAQQCAGYLYLMKAMAKLPRDHDLAEHRNRIDMSADCFRNPTVFIEYHTKKPPLTKS